MQTAAPSFWPLELPAVTVASGILAPHHRPQRRECVERGVGSRVLIAVDHPGAALAVGHLHGHDLLAEYARLVRGDRPLVRAEGELVLLVARNRVLAAEVLGRLDHPARHRVVDAAGGDPPADQAVLEHRATGAGSPAQRRRVELGLAHALGAAGEHEVGGAGLNLHARLDHRLQPGAAAAVDLEAWHVDRQPRIERRHAAERGRLTVRITLTQQHVVDLVAPEARARDQLLDHGRRERRHADLPEHAAETANRRPERLADQSVAHPAPA